MRLTRTAIQILLLSISLTIQAQVNVIEKPVPFDPEPVDETPCFDASPGNSGTFNLVYFGENITSNQNNCDITIGNEPVDIAFYFHDYEFYRSYGTAPSGMASITMKLVQLYAHSGDELLSYVFDVRVNRSTNELIFVRDTLRGLYPGDYRLTFEGISTKNDGGIHLLSNGGATVSPQTSVLPGPNHRISVTMAAFAIEHEQSDGDFPDIPHPDPTLPNDWSTTAGRNSIYKYVSLDGSNTSGISTVEYYDDFGRGEETVNVAATPDFHDLVAYKEYDEYGREARQWLPAVSTSSVGEYMPFSLCHSASPAANGDSEPFAYPVYEASPLNRVVENYGAGQSWHQQGKKVKTDYLFNGTGELACRRYVIQQGSSMSMTLSTAGNYGNGKLQVIKKQDEDNNTVLEFKDMQDRTVLTRMVIGGSTYADTYYIYDGVGRLRAVLPPELVAQTGLGTVSSDLIDRYAFLYNYDSCDRLTSKKIPGAGWCTFSYDSNNRLVFSTDAEQASRDEKTFYIYDALGRECIRGTANTMSIIPKSLQPNLVAPTTLSCKYTGATNEWMGYNVTGPLLLDVNITSVNYYDTYDFADNLSLPNSAPLYGDAAPHTRGLLTGTVTARLQNTNGTSTPTGYDYGLIRYDDRNRVVHTETTNHLGGYDIEDISLSHTGLPMERRLMHHVPQKSDQTQLYRYTYDHQNRLLTTTHSLNNGSAVTLASNTYDNLGRLVGKVTGGISTSYTYNVRSWLKSITSGTKFSETLFYNESHDGNTPRWGGDISAMDWKADSKTRGYVFSYDGLSRLTQASYSENGTGNGHYNTEYTYDKMGNILSLTRYGLRDNNQYGLIDNLTFTYNGNQVTKVEDAVSGPYYSGAFHFVNGSNATTEYTYDQNGNMTKDLNKGISSIQYNLLNLPSRITYSDGRMADYVYSATGTKLSVTYTNGGSIKNNQYCGNMLYENGTLKQILIDGGYITFNGSTLQYHFYLKDHLGNNRVVVNASGTVEQVNHYYPFGGLMGESTNGDIQRYKYNGKELDRMNGLDWYDYGARYMDGIRFTTMDPMAEKYYDISPYVYCAGNPVNAIDINGEDGVKIVDDENKTITVKADYFVRTSNTQYRDSNGNIQTLSGYSSSDIEEMNSYNDYLNELNLTIPSGDYKGYKLIFNLTFIDGGATEILKASSDNYEGYNIGNSIAKGTSQIYRNVGFEKVERSDGTTYVIGGITQENRNIVMNVGYSGLDTKMNRIHEIFHTFGFSHPKGYSISNGIMNYPPHKPSMKDALIIANSSFLPLINIKK